MTLTVVGYGDPISMPDLSTYPEDVKIILFCMIAGFLSFQSTQVRFAKVISAASQNDMSLKEAL